MYHLLTVAVILNALINLWRLVRNASTRLLRTPPDYVALDVSGFLPELETRTGFLRRRLGASPSTPSLERLRATFERISADGRCKGVVLRVRGLDAEWAALEELRYEVRRFQRRGGRVVAYLIEADTRACYLASAADEVLATPLCTVSLLGVRTRVSFLKDALDQVGVEAEVLAVSPYKSAGETFTRNDFSTEAREQAERLVDGRFSDLVEAIAEGRGMSPDEVREKIDRAPHSAASAVEEGLLDGVCYEDELAGRLGGDERAKVVEWSVARRSLTAPYRKSARRRIGVVGLSGVIVRGKSRRLPLPLPLVGAEQAGDESVVGALRAAERSRRVAAVLFCVDSRGGDALASDLIWREVERIRAKKPVVVLMGGAAASGGYYVSAAASHIVARRTTITGSIGVIITRPVATELYEKLGVHPASVERGARAALLDPARKPTSDELEVLEGQLQSVYGEFKERVIRGRGIEFGALENIAGGRVWSGAEARERGLVDEVGGFREAARRAGELAGVDAEAPQVLLGLQPPRSGRLAPGEPARMMEDVRWAVSELASGRVWATLPYEITGR